jgi:hypothetical protein
VTVFCQVRPTGLPVWAAVNAGLLRGFEPPATVKALQIWADLDRSLSGQEAALALMERLLRRRQDLAVRVLLPPGPIPADQKSVDWLDVLNSRGPQALAAVA